MTLQRFCSKKKSNQQCTVGYATPRLVFSSKEELLLVKYIKRTSELYYGLTPDEVKKLAFEFASANNVSTPSNWQSNEKAGPDWFGKLLKRHPSLSIRTPEATSLGRATSFNRTNVEKFFTNLASILERYKFHAHEIYNCDETGLTTVQRPNKIVAKKGTKQIGAITSAERGVLVTMCLAVSATGHCVPPLFVFPRKHFKDHFIKGGPPGCIGTAHPSGWMTVKNFLVFAKHFVNVVKCTKENPVLLLLDNHDSHSSIQTIDFYKENGVVLLSFPPHCSHKLQPLNRSVFGPLKKFYSSACDSFLKSDPGKPITMYDIPDISKQAIPLAATPNNIQKGFLATGVAPFNPNIFTEEEYLPSFTTDRPLAEDEESTNAAEQCQAAFSAQNEESQCTVPPPSGDTAGASEVITSGGTSDSALLAAPTTPISSHAAEPISAQSAAMLVSQEEIADESQFKTPEMIRPFKKAKPRKKTNRRRRTSTILTSTPEQKRVREEAAEKAKKNSKNPKRRKLSFSKKKATTAGDDCRCLVCGDFYHNSASGEEWVQCVRCKQWAHFACTDGSQPYLCDFC